MAEQWKCYTKPFRDTWIHLLHSDVNLQVSDGTIPGYSCDIRRQRVLSGFSWGVKSIKRNATFISGDITIIQSKTFVKWHGICGIKLPKVKIHVAKR